MLTQLYYYYEVSNTNCSASVSTHRRTQSASSLADFDDELNGNDSTTTGDLFASDHNVTVVTNGRNDVEQGMSFYLFMSLSYLTQDQDSSRKRVNSVQNSDPESSDDVKSTHTRKRAKRNSRPTETRSTKPRRGDYISVEQKLIEYSQRIFSKRILSDHAYPSQQMQLKWVAEIWSDGLLEFSVDVQPDDAHIKLVRSNLLINTVLNSYLDHILWNTCARKSYNHYSANCCVVVRLG